MSQETVSIRQLLADVAKDAKHLLQVQTELAKTETKEAQQEATKTGGAFAVAAGAGVMGGIFLLVTIAWGLVELGLPTWAGFGIVTLVLFITAAIAGIIGKKKSQQISKLNITKREIDRTKQILSGATRPTTDIAVPTAVAPAQRQQ